MSAFDVRAWVERHRRDGEGWTDAVERLAGLLRVRPPRRLFNWMAEGGTSARTLPPYIQAHMETLDTHEGPGA